MGHLVRLAILLSTVSAAAGCGGSATLGPCETSDAPAECGAPCTFDSDCALGFHCTEDGTCTAECTEGGGQCADGYDCDDRGRCVPGDGTDGGGEGCPRTDVRLEPEVPTVVILIDQSGSMSESFGSTNRWEATKTALVDPAQGAVSKLQDRVKFGAALYTSNGGNAGGVCPLLQETPGAPALNNLPAIEALLGANGPAGDTPTAESITAVIAGFPLPDPEKPGPRVLLLATDGDPDNCVDPNAHDATSKAMSEAAVEAAWNAGITTIPLSVGTSVSLTHLERLADLGIGSPAGSGQGTAYVASTPQALVDAFEAIIRGVRTCQLQVDGTLDPNRADEGTVTLNGQDLQYGVDWQVVDEHTVELLGAACEAFLETDSVVLSASFPCGVVVK